MLFYTTFARRTFTVSLNELFENYTGRHTHVYSVRMSRWISRWAFQSIYIYLIIQLNSFVYKYLHHNKLSSEAMYCFENNAMSSKDFGILTLVFQRTRMCGRVFI